MNMIFDELQTLYAKEKKIMTYRDINQIELLKAMKLAEDAQTEKEEIEAKRQQENDSFARLMMKEQIQDQHVSKKHYAEKVQTFFRRIYVAEVQLNHIRRDIEPLEKMFVSFFSKEQLERLAALKN